MKNRIALLFLLVFKLAFCVNDGSQAHATYEYDITSDTGAATVTNLTMTQKLRNASTASGDLVSLGFQTGEGADAIRAKISSGKSGAGGTRGFLSLSTRTGAGTVLEGFRLDDTQAATFAGSLGVTGILSAGTVNVTGDITVTQATADYYYQGKCTSADAASGGLSFEKSRGATTDVNNGDQLLILNTSAYSSGQKQTGSIRYFVDGTFTTGQRPPSRAEVWVNPANTAATKQFVVSSSGSTVAANTAATSGGSTIGLLFGSSPSLGIYFGSGAPTISAGKGSLYLRTDGTGATDRAYINTNGSTTWTNLVTAL